MTKGPEDDEVTLFCHFTDKKIKKRGIRNRFDSRFEEELCNVHDAPSRKHGTKDYLHKRKNLILPIKFIMIAKFGYRSR